MADHANSTPAPLADSLIRDIALTEIDGEPRALDLDIAERLGFTQTRDIRKLIKRHLIELETFGPARQRGALVSRPQGGAVEVDEYWLNEEQSLLVSVLSKAPHAPAVRAMLIRCFVRWRRGESGAAPFPPDIAEKIDRIFGIERMLSHKVTEIEKAIPRLIRMSIEQAILADPRRAALDYVSVRELLNDAKAEQRKRNRVNRKIGFELRALALTSAPSAELRRCAHSNVWLYPRAFANAYMASRGSELVREHNDEIKGQSVLKLVPRKTGEDAR